MKDIYWHIQMHLPEGKGGTIIDPEKMLSEDHPVIGTGEWDDIQCRNFKGEDNGMKIGDIVMVRKGNMPIAICEIVGDCFSDEKLEDKYLNKWYRHVKVLGRNTSQEKSSLFSQGTLKRLYKSRGTDSWHYINDWYTKITKRENMNDLIDVLKAKHQIILQGAPGTGKTYMAKKLARELTKGIDVDISDDDIIQGVCLGITIPSSANKTSYVIKEIKNSSMIVGGEGIQDRSITFSQIKKAYKDKLWEPGKQRNGYGPYEAAVAKYVYEHVDRMNNFVKLVQFHPSYTYEDFVRGIVVETEEGTVNYKTTDKILGEFAKAALRNFYDSKKTVEQISKQQGYEKALELYKNHINDSLMTERSFKINGTGASIVAVSDKSFRYSFKDRPSIRYNLLFDDIIKVALNKETITKSSDIQDTGITVMKGNHPYYFHFNSAFQEYIKENRNSIEQTKSKVNEQNFVLIIDEINRANLPAVLGELIYALEYRDESVESMYAVDGDNTLIMPPNLYIIGTMNTADRSVGQIDYAIRRRFAFINMLPHTLDVDGFDADLFNAVSELFIKNHGEYATDSNVKLERSDYLSEEFRPEDVWLGHSYFIMNEDNRAMRLKYEIKPILMEYLRDGIFKPNAEEKINNLS